MYDRLVIATKVKNTIEYIEKTVINYPHEEKLLKDRIISTSYDLLEIVYYANLTKDINSMKNIIVKIKMIDFYLKESVHRKLISLKKFESVGNYLLEINKMVNAWIGKETPKSEASK